MGQEGIDQAPRLVKAGASAIKIQCRGFFRALQGSPVQRLQLIFAHGTAQLLFTVVDGAEQACGHAWPHAGKDFCHGQLGHGFFDDMAHGLTGLGGLVHGSQTFGVHGRTKVVLAPDCNAQLLLGRLIQSLQVAALHIAAGAHARAKLRTRTQIQQQGAVAHRAADNVVGRQANGTIQRVRPCRHPPTTGLEAKQAAMRGRNADGATAIAGMPHGQDTCSHYRSRATGRASGRMAGAPGVAGDAIELGLRGGGHAELWRGCLAKDVQACGLVALHQGGVVCGHRILEEGAALRGHGASHAHAQILEHKGNTPQSGLRCSALALCCTQSRQFLGMGACLLVVLDDHGVEPGQSLHLGNRCVQQLQRRDFALAQLLCQIDGVCRSVALHCNLGLCLGSRQCSCRSSRCCSNKKCSAIRVCHVVLHVFVSVDFLWGDLRNS